MRKSKVKKTLESIGINPRDDEGNIRSADDLTEEVMAVFNQCNGVNKMSLISMIKLSRMIDDDMFFLCQY